MAATTIGTSGSDTLIGGSGTDTLDGGAGSDFLNAGSGDDLLRYVLSDNLAACKDIYIGGSGKDTLVMVLNEQQWSQESVRSQLFNYLNHLKTVTNAKTGEVSSAVASDYLFTFGTSTLSVQMVEKLKVTVGDRTVLDSTDTTASAANLTVAGVSGNEDTSIDLSGTISAQLTDTDGTEWISGFRITGIPQGAVLSNAAGNLAVGADGSITLTPPQLQGLTIRPPADSDVDLNLGVSAITTEINGMVTAHSAVKTLAITVNAVADAPVLTVEDATGNEDSAIEIGSKIHALLNDTDGSESLTVSLAGIPDGATLSNEHGDTLVPNNGVITLTVDQLAGLKVTPPSNSDTDFMLQVTATSTEQNGGMQAYSSVETIHVTVNSVADKPVLDVTAATGDEDAKIDIGSHISAALTDTDGSESLNIWIQDLPAGATLTLKDGTVLTPAAANVVLEVDSQPVLLGDGVLLDAAQLDGLSITAPQNSDADFALKVGAISIEQNGGYAGNGLQTLNVAVNAVADLPGLTVAPATGDEDTPIAIGDKILASLTDADGSESLTITIDGIPPSARIQDGAGHDIAAPGGTLTLTVAELAGLTITPALDSDADFDLAITATATESSNGSFMTTALQTLTVTVNAVADMPTLWVANTGGDEDTWIPIGSHIDAQPVDNDGSEDLSVTISGIPDGAILQNAAHDVLVVVAGSLTVSASQLAGLELLPPPDSGDDFDLTITATATEMNGGASSTTPPQTLKVAVNAVADAPQLTVDPVSGDEDSFIPIGNAIHAQLSDTDGSELLMVQIEGLPDGAKMLDSEGHEIAVGPNGFTIDAAQLAGLTVVPPSDSDKDFALQITAISTEQENGSWAKAGPYTMQVTVNPVADIPSLSVADASGNEDQPIAIGDKVTASLNDNDGSETLTITIGNIPAGATFTNTNGDTLTPSSGSLTLNPDQLAGLAIQAPSDSDADLHLSVKATSTESDGGAPADSPVQTLNITVNAVADAPTLAVEDTSGDEDQPIAIGDKIHAALVDTDGSETLAITIGNIPTGATFTNTAGNTLIPSGGSLTLTPAQLAGLTIQAPSNSDVDIYLSVSATSSDTGNLSTATAGPLTLAVMVNAVADAPTLAVTATSGDVNTAIAIGSHISAALTDADGSEYLGITIGGIPAGATLTNTAGDTLTVSGGSITLTSAQLAGLAITPPLETSADFSLQVSASSTETTGGSTATTGPQALAVTVNDIVVDPQGTVLTGGSTNTHFTVGLNQGLVTISDIGGGQDDLTVTTTAATSFSTFNFERVGDNLVLSLGSGSGSSTITVQNHFGAGTNAVETVYFSGGGTAFGYNLGTSGYNLLKDLGGTGQEDVIASSALGQTLTGGNGNDLLFGNDGNDTANGGAGSDLLIGGAGNDRMIGGDGNDVLVGGAGIDTFVFNTAPNGSTNVDEIRDFNANAEDLIELAASNFGGLAGTGTLNVNDFTSVAGGGTASVGAGVNIIFDSSTGNLYYDSTGGSSADRTLVAHLTVAGGTIDNADFKVV